MILVVYGHSCKEFGLINQWICSFFMALFFISSGYTWHKKEHWIQHNLRTIYLPYFLWGLIGLLYALVKALASNTYEDMEIWRKIYRMVTGIASDNYPLWFLVAFFVAKIVYDSICVLIEKFYSNRSNKYRSIIEIISVLVICACGYAYTLHKPLGHSILRFDTGLVMLPFFTVGKYLSPIFYLIEKNGFAILTLAIAMAINLITGILLNSLVSVNSNEFGNIICFFMSSIAGTIAVFIGCKYCSRFSLIRKILAFWGRYSLTLLCSHAFVLTAVTAFLFAFFPTIHIYPVIITAACLLVLAPFVPMFDRGVRFINKLF